MIRAPMHTMEQAVLVVGIVALAVAFVIVLAGAVIDWVLRHRR